MILHLTPGSEPIQVHVHGEFGTTHRVTVSPHLASPAVPAPAPAHARRWPLAAIPVTAVLAGFIGYKIGAPAPGDEAPRVAAYRDVSPGYLQPAPGPVRSLDGPILRTIPPAVASMTAPSDVPGAVAQLLAQPPSVTPAPGTPAPATVPQPPAPGSRNPFGLE